jgi:hypothetical protein
MSILRTRFLMLTMTKLVSCNLFIYNVLCDNLELSCTLFILDARFLTRQMNNYQLNKISFCELYSLFFLLFIYVEPEI